MNYQGSYFNGPTMEPEKEEERNQQLKIEKKTVFFTSLVLV